MTQQKMLKCPDCGKKCNGGTGLAAHRRFSHGGATLAEAAREIDTAIVQEAAEVKTSPPPPVAVFNYETFTRDLTRFREGIPDALAELRKRREAHLTEVQVIESQIVEIERLASLGSVAAPRAAAG